MRKKIMKIKSHFLLLIFLSIIISTSSIVAQSIYEYDYSLKNYYCTSRFGTEAGYGRVVRAGEYSSYFKKTASDNEFIAFQYTVGGKEYWFHTNKCRKISN